MDRVLVHQTVDRQDVGDKFVGRRKARDYERSLRRMRRFAWKIPVRTRRENTRYWRRIPSVQDGLYARQYAHT